MNRCAILIISLVAVTVLGQEQLDIRLNPELGEEHVREAVHTPAYPFINIRANKIDMNGDDWSGLSAAFARCDSSVVRILHIGDSHIQAEGSTCRTRAHLHEKYGSAGRGLTAPFRLAGTNAPMDYSYKSNLNFTGSRLLKTPWPTEMGFSGVAVAAANGKFDITVACGDAFDKLCIYTAGNEAIGIDSVVPDVLVSCFSPCDDVTELLLTGPVTELSLHMNGSSALTGIELLRGGRGVEYSAIGNNGATFASYNSVPGFAAGASRLQPHLIILSLGTNEAFGRLDAEEMTMQIHQLVCDLRAACPYAKFLLTTPQECCKRIVSHRGRGRKRRTTRTYAVNDNVARAREIIKNYGVTHEIPVYDWYAVAGGQGSSAKWSAEHLMNTDHIHLTWDGYYLNGDLFYAALNKAISSYNFQIDN
ncbi:MAG: hypothetical protein K2L21_02170 [Muribaculaceae bacterium]|nr:hypothetical protein [Muribaculaceae bacterium]